MMLHIEDKEFEVYRLKSKDRLLVAIPTEYVESIYSSIKEFGNIDSVPAERTVRGIFINHENGPLGLIKDRPQNDIVINQIIIK
jgi:hypothetical protein